MRYLLDTSTFLWFLSDDRKLKSGVRDLLQDRSDAVALSYVSLWELAIKISVGKLDSEFTIADYAHLAFELEGFSPLFIELPHLERYATLPLLRRDPFDRLLIAQSMVEDIPILSGDAAFDRYPIQRV